MKDKTKICPHCNKITAITVHIDPDNLELAYNDPVSYGLCEHCNKPFKTQKK